MSLPQGMLTPGEARYHHVMQLLGDCLAELAHSTQELRGYLTAERVQRELDPGEDC